MTQEYLTDFNCLKEVKQKADNEHKNVFLCYRGTTRKGGETARLIYYNLLISNYPELVPFCASLCNKEVDFAEASKRCIPNCKVFVPIFTEDFTSSATKNTDDQVRLELAVAVGEIFDKNKHIKLTPIYVADNAEDYRAFNNTRDNLSTWLKDPLTLDFLAKFGYFKNQTVEYIYSKIDEFVLNILHVSEPYTFILSRRDDETLQETLVKITHYIKRAYDRKATDSTGKIWVGTRLSDIEHAGKLLNGAITLFGKNNAKEQLYALCDDTLNERVDHNVPEERQDEFIRKTMHELVNNSSESNPVSFYFYNQLCRYTIAGLDDIANHFLCVNDDRALLERISNKLTFHEAYGHRIANGNGLLKVTSGNYTDCNYAGICERLCVSVEDNYKFIVQAAIASGGSGTYIMTKENASLLNNHLSHNTTYLYSIYQENNVPINLHAIIFKQGVVLLPGSIQLMRTDYDNIEHESEIKRLMYRGADFIEYSRLSELADVPENKINCRHFKKFESLCLELCNILKDEGYVGVLGIDGMIYGDQVSLLEVNCRFQASTGLINRALQESGLPSVQQANFDAFYNPHQFTYWDNVFKKFTVNYANYSYNNIGCNEHPKHVFQIASNNQQYSNLLEADGYSNDVNLANCAATSHLFRLNFDTNICWVNEEGRVLLNENISEPIKEFKNKILSCATSATIDEDTLLALKIALLTQGVVIEKTTLTYLKQSKAKGIRPATNSAVDISFSEEFMAKCHFDSDVKALVINAPCDIKFNEFTPFTLKMKDDEKLALYYYNTEISRVSLYPLDPLETLPNGNNRLTNHHNTKYSDVAYLSTDRLRVHVTNSCLFKEGDVGCKFCNIERTCEDIDIEDIREVIDAHWANRKSSGLRHFLIGGQSPKQNKAMREKLLAIIEHLHNLPGETPDIYAMILPCQDEQELSTYGDLVYSYFEKGLTELSLNIEIFDDELAKKYMPGKGITSREMYRCCLIEASEALKDILGPHRAPETREKIRTMIIYGLEPENSFMEGMKWLVDNGIQPIISLFRPLKNTQLADFIAPPMIEVYNLYKKVELLYNQKNQRINLGPNCTYCQNNTLSLPKRR